MSTTFHTPAGAGPHQQTDSIKRALTLRDTALALANQLFDQGDLSSYLDILVRLNYLNFYNLLLVLHQYPNATHLAFFANWRKWIKRQNPDTKWFLKNDEQGHEIELLAPYTLVRPGDCRSLSWCTLPYFDVSQTNAEHYQPSGRDYLAGPDHVHLLFRCLRNVLSEEYNTVIQADLNTLTHPVGYFEDNTIHCSPTSHTEDLVMLLTQHLFILAHPEHVVGEAHTPLFLHMAQHCLYRIWNMQDHRMLFLSTDPDQIRCISPTLRPLFLDLLQRQVRHADELLYSKYQELLSDS